MRRRTILVLLLGAAVSPWVTAKWVNPISFAFFGLVSVLALATVVLVVAEEQEWALHLSITGCLAAFGSLAPLSAFVTSVDWMLPAVLKLGASGSLLGLAHLLLRHGAERQEEAWGERFRRSQEERRARGLTRGKAIEAHRSPAGDPWDE